MHFLLGQSPQTSAVPGQLVALLGTVLMLSGQAVLLMNAMSGMIPDGRTSNTGISQKPEIVLRGSEMVGPKKSRMRSQI
jgi:hypothetical protein